MRVRAARAMSSSTASRRKPASLRQTSWRGNILSRSRAFPTLKRRPLPTPSARPEPCSAASASRAWSSRPRGSSTRILTPRAKRRPLPSATISAAARAMSRSSTASCLRRRFYARGKFPKRRKTFRLARACTASMSPKRCRATASTPMTSMLTACAMAARCAASTRAPACSTSARKKRKSSPASSAC